MSTLLDQGFIDLFGSDIGLAVFLPCAFSVCGFFRCGDVSLAVSNLDMHALFVLGDLRAKLVKLFQSRFVYITEQNAEGIYVAEIDTESALVVDDKPCLLYTSDAADE